MERLYSEGYPDVQPDSYTLNIVMKALTSCGEEGAADKANDILKRMEKSSSAGDHLLKANLLSYNTVLDSYAKKGDAIAAEALLNQMYIRAKTESGISEPDAHSYTAVLSAWARYEDKSIAVTRAEELFNDLERKWAAGETDTRADTSVYNALINCWAKSGDKKVRWYRMSTYMFDAIMNLTSFVVYLIKRLCIE
jgi:pentatricopeptide repeat protein